MQKKHKEIILGIIVIFLSFLCWWMLKLVFCNNYSVNHWFLVLAVFILFGIALCLAMLLIENKIILLGSFGLALILFLIFFNQRLIYFLLVLILLFLAFLIAAKKIKKEEEIQVNLNFFRIFKRGLPIFMTALTLLISVVYYFSPAINRINTEITIPRSIFDTVFNAVSEPLNRFQGKFLLNSDDLYENLNMQINKNSRKYEETINYGLAIALFFTLKLITLVLVPIIIILSWLAIRILIRFNFVKLEKTQKEVETVKL